MSEDFWENLENQWDSMAEQGDHEWLQDYSSYQRDEVRVSRLVSLILNISSHDEIFFKPEKEE